MTSTTTRNVLIGIVLIPVIGTIAGYMIGQDIGALFSGPWIGSIPLTAGETSRIGGIGDYLTLPTGSQWLSWNGGGSLPPNGGPLKLNAVGTFTAVWADSAGTSHSVAIEVDS